MSEMVERMAWAYENKMHQLAGGEYTCKRDRAKHVEAMKEALAAAREPTERMAEAGWKAFCAEPSMSEMVDRVAKALHIANLTYGNRDLPGLGDANQEWDRLPVRVWDFYRTYARAMIAAQREPTAAMVEAGSQASIAEGARDCEISMGDVWRAMNDEALK